MRFLNLLISAVTATLALASPLALVDVTAGIAGSVVTDKGVTYEMKSDLDNWIKWFDDRVDNGNYPRPVTYQVNAGHHCIFYTEASRGVGWPIGEFAGPTSGAFDKWVAFYKCWPVTVTPRALDKVSRDGSAPCGFTIDQDRFGQQTLHNTGYKPDMLNNFAVESEGFMPEFYHVNEGCECWWYSAHDGRGGSERIGTAKGNADGTFSRMLATRYACFRY